MYFFHILLLFYAWYPVILSLALVGGMNWTFISHRLWVHLIQPSFFLLKACPNLFLAEMVVVRSKFSLLILSSIHLSSFVDDQMFFDINHVDDLNHDQKESYSKSCLPLVWYVLISVYLCPCLIMLVCGFCGFNPHRLAELWSFW